MVLEAAHLALGLPRETPIRTRLGDARVLLKTVPPGARFDLIFSDAFTHLAAPWQLTTLEFNRLVEARLAPGGIYLVNVVDDLRHGHLLAAFLATLGRVFPSLQVFAMGAHRRSYSTFIVVASRAPLDLTAWQRGVRREGSPLPPAEVAALRRRGRLLTDDSAPVENLLGTVTGAVRVRRIRR